VRNACRCGFVYQPPGAKTVKLKWFSQFVVLFCRK
jgi:hypothetical protein